jgi:hypothetical protein
MYTSLKILKIHEANRGDVGGVFKAQIDSFEEEVEELFDISARDTYKQLSWEPRVFLCIYIKVTPFYIF